MELVPCKLQHHDHIHHVEWPQWHNYHLEFYDKAFVHSEAFKRGDRQINNDTYKNADQNPHL